jgi:hypothetical protein
LTDLLLSPNAGDYVDVNMYQWLMKATLDAIGFGECSNSQLLFPTYILSPLSHSEAAFDYDFGALDERQNDLGNAFRKAGCVSISLHAYNWYAHGRFKYSVSANGSDFEPKTLLAIRLSQFVPEKLLRYMYRNSSDPRLKFFVQTNELSKKVARELVTLKMRELKDGVAKKDVLSLISMLPLMVFFFSVILICNLGQSKPTRARILIRD